MKFKPKQIRMSDEVAMAILGRTNKIKRYKFSSEKEYNLVLEKKRKYISDRKLSKYKKEQIDKLYEIAKIKQFDKTKNVFFVTWAQIDTAINSEMLTNMEVLAKKYNASIHVIAGRYKNPNSLEKSKQIKASEKSNNWDKRIQNYLDANRQNLHNNLCLLADVKIQPTALNPLGGMESLTDLESCIIGHPHLHFKSLPILPSYPNKVLLTTGAITQPNYTDTKIGKRSEFHHSFGFVVVELDEDYFHVRQVSVDKDGSFYDLNNFVSNGKIMKAKNYPAYTLGDLHLGVEDKKKVDASFNLIDKIGFKEVILHDVFDGMSVNHHELRNPFLLLEREKNGQLDLSKEIDYVLRWFENKRDYNFISVASNHNDFLDRWLMSNDWRNAPNKELYLKLANLKVNNPNNSVITTLLKELPNVKSIEYGGSYRLYDWELALHGDKGSNGSRGSANQFKSLNTKTITAHSHSPSRQLGNITAGTSTKLDLGYNVGLCSWMQSDVILYPNGKASLINFVNGKFTTLI